MNPVDTVNDEYISIVKYLDDSSQPSLSSDVNKYFKKILILSSASYFEHLIQDALVTFISRETGNNIKAVNLFKKKAISMQYHTYFSWGEKNNPDKPGVNANTFFSLFGEEFKKEMESEVNNNDVLKDSMKSFIEIGHLRNILVHSNFAAYNLDGSSPNRVGKLT